MKQNLELTQYNLQELPVEQQCMITGGHNGGSYEFGKAVGRAINDGLNAAADAISSFWKGFTSVF